MTYPQNRDELRHLAESSVLAILHQMPVSVTRAANCECNGFPLPIKRNRQQNPDGTITQEYRPLAVLEYVNDVFSGALAARQAKERATKKAGALDQ